MERAIKRVSLDFTWPLGLAWHGYVNPWPPPVPCLTCHTSGLNPASKKLADTFKSWAPKMTIEEGLSLIDLGHDPMELMMLKDRKGLDSPVLRHNLVEVRGKRKGIWGPCTQCRGEGFVINPNPAVKTLYEGINLYEEWEPTDPPEGPGWQLWEDPETGGPISPVFESPKELAAWCSEKSKKHSLEKWLTWIASYPIVSKPKLRPSFRIRSDSFLPPSEVTHNLKNLN